MGYRPRTQPPATAWARFIDRQLKARGWSATKAFEEVRAGLGLGEKSRSAFLPYLSDKEPDEKVAAVFRDVFGGEPGDEDRGSPPPPAADLAAVITELQEQNRQLRALVAQMTRIGDGQLAWGRALGEIAGKALERRSPEGNPGARRQRPPRQSQPQQTAGK